MKKISVLLVMLIVSFTAAFAYDVEVDGLYYNLIKGNNAELVAGDVKYSGDVVIPPAITVNGVQYKVAIIAGAFNKCDGLTSVVVPETVTDLGNDAFQDCM